MKKYALGTVLGTALLSLAKKNTKGSNIRIKPVAFVQGGVSCQVNIELTLIRFGLNKYKNLILLTEKVWNELPKTRIEKIQSSEQQSSEQQSSGAPAYTYTKENNEVYRILWCDLLITLQQAIGERIEDLVHSNPDFKYPEGWDENIHSWSVDTDMMDVYSDDAEDYNEFVDEEKTFFWFRIYMSQKIEEPPFPNEDIMLTILDDLFDQLWDQVWDASYKTIKEEFFMNRMSADMTWNAESDVSVENYLAIEKDGEWVRYNKPKSTRAKLRKK